MTLHCLVSFNTKDRLLNFLMQFLDFFIEGKYVLNLSSDSVSKKSKNINLKNCLVYWLKISYLSLKNNMFYHKSRQLSLLKSSQSTKKHNIYVLHKCNKQIERWKLWSLTLLKSVIHYSQRGLHIYRESSWCEIDHGLISTGISGKAAYPRGTASQCTLSTVAVLWKLDRMFYR